MARPTLSSKPPSPISTLPATKDVLSDASPHVVSKAQSAILMRGQIATSHDNVRSQPPIPGPAPTRALPSLPEGHEAGAPATPSPSKLNLTVVGGERSPIKAMDGQKLLRREGYCSPVKIRRHVSPEPVKMKASSPLHVNRQGVSIPRSDHVTKNMSLEALNEWQRRRKEKTTARKARDLKSVRLRGLGVGEGAIHASTVLEGEQRRDGLGLSASIGEDPSGISAAKHQHHTSQADGLSAHDPEYDRRAVTKTATLSPIITVAEQAPTPSHSQTLEPRRPSLNPYSATPKPYSTNFHPRSSPPFPPSLHLPPDNHPTRPLSTHSLPSTHPLTSQIPTQHATSFPHTRSNRSAYRTTRYEGHVRELEARVEAVEKKNGMLERALLAMLAMGAGFGGGGGGGGDASEGEGGIADGGTGDSGGGNRLSEGGGVESLYDGLEKLLAVHEGEVGRGSAGFGL